MIEDDVMQLVQQVRPLGDHAVEIVPATEDQLNSFERDHRLTLPPELKAWFRRCNGADVNPGGLDSLFPREHVVCLDWHFKQYPQWKKKGWFPLGSDGCGDVYILTSQIIIPSTGTHPVFFLDQADFEQPQYAIASGLWKFLYFLLENEIRSDAGRERYWPWNKEAVLAVDPHLAECRGVPLPWEIEAG